VSELRYTLLSDGSSDRALIPILTWLLQTQGVVRAIQSEWAELRRLRRPPTELAARIEKSLELYPCDLLFVHRDAEALEHRARREQIRQGVDEAAARLHAVPPTVCVVPVRMQEAWFLFNEQAIRRAAGNPYGRQPLQLPRLPQIEELPDPKVILFNLLREASGLTGRRQKKMQVSARVHRIAELTDDFSPLRTLPAFVCLEDEVAQAVEKNGWTGQ